MATLKIISNKDCKLYIDQVFVCDLSANKLVKHAIDTGIYLIDVIANDESLLTNSESFDLEIVESEQQILKRITFASAKEPVVSKEKENEEEDFSNNPDLIFYNGFALVSKGNKYGFVDKSFKWVIEPQFDVAEPLRNGHSIVCKMFDGKQKLSLLDSQCKMTLGMWFDEILYKTTDYFVVRRQDELFKIDLQRMVYVDAWHLEGHVYENKPIAVSISNDISKRYGFIDIKGNVVLPFIYDYVSDFSDSGWAEVEKYGIRRYINLEGDVNVLNTLEDIEANAKQYYVLKLNKKYDWEEPFEWCGLLEYPNKEDLFLSGVYRLPVRKNGKWGYACLKEEQYNGPNTIKMMLDCKYDKFLSNSKYGYVIAKDGDYLSIVNLIDAKYSKGEKEGQYVYGAMGNCLFKMKCQEMYPINIMKHEWIDNESKYNIFDNVVVKVSGKYGICHKNGKMNSPCIYDNIYVQEQGNKPSRDFVGSGYVRSALIIEKNGLKGLISDEGIVLLAVSSKELYRIGLFWKIKNSQGYYQLFNANNQTMLAEEFDHVEYRNCDYFICKKGKWGCYNGEGELVVNAIFDKIEHLKLRNNGFGYVLAYLVYLNNKVGLLSNEGNSVIPCLYDKISPLNDIEGRQLLHYLVTKNGRIAFWSVTGEQETDFIYDNCKFIDSDYNEDNDNYEFWNVLLVSKEGKCALMKDDFNCLTDFVLEECEIIWKKRFGKIIFSKVNNLWGCVDIKGKPLVNFEYDDFQVLPVDNLLVMVKKQGKTGVVACWDYYSEDEYYDLDCVYDELTPLYQCNQVNGYVGVYNGESEFIDRFGDILIYNFNFDDATAYYDDNRVIGAAVKSGKLWGFVNHEGELVVPCEYNSIRPCIVDKIIILFIITKGRKVGAITPKLDVIVNCIYDNMDFEKTDKNYFLCYNSGDALKGNARKVMLIGSLKEMQLESIRPYDCVKELEELGY